MPTTKSVKLRINLSSNVPGFKNRKRGAISKHSGQVFQFTPKNIKKRMQEMESAFVSALLSELQTMCDGTLTGRSLRSLIRSSLPDDDCWQCIPEILVRMEKSEQAFVEIEIEEIL